MRECPKCHYVDPPYWLAHFKDREKDIIHLDDFQLIAPELYREVLASHGVFIQGPYAYRIPRGNKVVYRLWLPLYKARGNSFRHVQGYFDGQTLESHWRHDAKRDPCQMRLEPAKRSAKPTRAKSRTSTPSKRGMFSPRRGVSRRPEPLPESNALTLDTWDRKEGSRRV